MKIYTCIDHAQHFPVGCASVVIASNRPQAKKLLDAELKEHGLKAGGYTLQEIDVNRSQAIVLRDGDY